MGRFYPSVLNQPEDYLVLSLTDTTLGTLSQLQWNEKDLNKSGANNHRRNPERQAAVRCFKKYRFLNPDSSLKQSLRSVKKELQLKQRRVSTKCVTKLRCKNSNNTNTVVSSTTSMKNKNIKINQENEGQSKMNNSEEFNLEKEIKLCPRKDWPHDYLERPTLENIDLNAGTTLPIDNELIEIVNESNVLLRYYSKSDKELYAIINYYEYSCLSDESSPCKQLDYEAANRSKSSEIRNRFLHSVNSDMMFGDVNKFSFMCNKDIRDNRISSKDCINDRDNNICLYKKKYHFDKLNDTDKGNDKDDDYDNDDDDVVDIDDDEVDHEDDDGVDGKDYNDVTLNYIKIRNRFYPISILDNNPTLIQYLKEEDGLFFDQKQSHFYPS